jgi:hypothetical protein
MGNRKIAILNIDSILNTFFSEPSEVPKCLLKQEKWLRESQKKKMIDGAISI